MSAHTALDSPLLAPVYRRLDASHSPADARLLKLFARHFYASSARSELARSTDRELCDSIMDAWQFMQQRKSARPRIHFVHRDLGREATRMTGTSIYVLVDDMPFLVDSISQRLSRAGVVIRNVSNAVFQVRRNDTGQLQDIGVASSPGRLPEALGCFNCARINKAQCHIVEQELRDTLEHVAVAVEDYPAMVEKASAIRDSLLATSGKLPVGRDELQESSEFIGWLLDNHFTFLGYEKYRINRSGREAALVLETDSLLGISRLSGLEARTRFTGLPIGASKLILKRQICSFARSSTRSKVHRPVYYNYVLLKEFDAPGKVAIEHRFAGLYTSSVYYRPVLEIPLVRRKVRAVLDKSGFTPNGHSIKELLQVINAFPRDELFQLSKERLFDTALEISRMQETRASRLFIRKDSYGLFFSCLVFVPRDVYSTRVHQRVERFLRQRLQAEEVEFDVVFTESLLVRLHFLLRAPAMQKVKYDQSELEADMIRLVKPWDDYFLEELLALHHDSRAERIHRIYANCYPEAYKEAYTAAEGVKDIQRIEHVLEGRELGVDLDSCESEAGAELSFKIFSHGQQLFLSEVAPILENLGLDIISEKAFRLEPETDTEREGSGDGPKIWLHDFALSRRKAGGAAFNEQLKSRFEEAFRAVWQGLANDDAFNELVVTADINFREAALLRACAAWMKQIQFGFSADFIADTLSRYHAVTEQLLAHFHCRFDPRGRDRRQTRERRIRAELLRSIDAVANLSEDLVLRSYLNLFDATLRTNWFQPGADGRPRDWFAFKFDCGRIDNLPLPRPKYEVFVYSPRMEGVHLRAGKVARGGLRWSERSEDYRTEALGLLKAQQVKNAVIVPAGAKGVFVIKEARPADRKAAARQAVECYRTFVRGLLDLGDNIEGDRIVPPPALRRHDDDDPYLVVAADKGTARFSDIANEVAAQYGFWLGDGFASGGSSGYDHKAMGITARGAWVSVQRHFRELAFDIRRRDFTVVGIGDMAGDVFGNGMLLSRHIRLVAAFNHRHIFIDPDPAPAAAYRERARLFRKSASSWADYNRTLISRGGGVFKRSAKSISVSPAMQARFHIERDSVTPDQLVRLLLMSPVDLIWNGGIGTFVKASHETHGDAGDKANDLVRVDARRLRCKVIGEGGNLGLTQAARIEYSLNEGLCLTDFIDNSAGVDCSDHEVNIKILLNRLVAAGRLSRVRRDRLLASISGAVAAQVLANNYRQVQAISVAWWQMTVRNREYAGLIAYLEQRAGLDRDLESLPDEEQLDARSAAGKSLTRPEIAVLNSCMKNFLKSQLAREAYLDDDYLTPCLYQAFPEQLVKTFRKAVHEHPLRREIIANQLVNSVVNLAGPSFVYRMEDSTGCTVAEVIKAVVIARDLLDVERTWQRIEALDYKVDVAVQSEMMATVINLVRRVTRWLLRNRRQRLDFRAEVGFFASGVRRVRTLLPGRLPANFAETFTTRLKYFRKQGVPEALAREVCLGDFLFPAISFIEISRSSGKGLAKVVDIYYALGERLQLNWLAKTIDQLGTANYWQVLAREFHLDDLSWQQRVLTGNVVDGAHSRGSAMAMVDAWIERHPQAVRHARNRLARLQAETQADYSMFAVVLRELVNLTQATLDAD